VVGDGGDRTYGGLIGTFPYVLRTSDSWLLRSYAVVGGLVALFVALLFAIGVVVNIGQTGTRGGTLTLSRAFIIVVALAAVAPLVAPVLLAARRHRRGVGAGRYDAVVALAGYGFLLSLYGGLVASEPPAGRATPTEAGLYAGIGLPAAGAALVVVAHLLARRSFRHDIETAT
jgi:hypothetical protein